MDSSQRNIGITIKNTAERDAMREAGRAAAQVLLMIEAHVKAGISTGELDRICREFILGPLKC